MTRTLLLAAVAGLAVAACRSPEEGRVRGGGAGADVGNRGDSTSTHGGSEMFYRTPCLMPEAECPGPQAASGSTGDYPPATSR